MPTIKPLRKPITQASPKAEDSAPDFTKMTDEEFAVWNAEMTAKTSALNLQIANLGDATSAKKSKKPISEAEEEELYEEEELKADANVARSKQTPAPDASIIDEVNETTLRLRTAGGGYKTFELTDILAINPDDLTTSFIEQPSIFGYFSTLAAQADDAAAKADSAKDQEFALAMLEVMNEAERNGKKLTVDQSKSLALTDKSYTKKVAQEQVTKLDAKLLKAMVAALEMRANMLISLGAMLRHEADMEGMQMKQRQMDAASNEVVAAAKARRLSK